MRYKILFFLLFALCIEVKATHVIGGTMTYECIGNNTYRVSYTMLRDCVNGVAEFDAPAVIGIFDNNGNLLTKIGTNGMVYLYYTKRSVPLDRSLIKDACLLPPNASLCIEEALYTADIVLPVRAGGYNLIYQRCCRNKIIQNIVDPLNTGASWNVYLSETTLKTCNSTPVFKKWSPTLLCAGKDYIFDHSALDKDSDSLVYSLWTPQRFEKDISNPIPVPPNNSSSDITWIPNVYTLNNQLGGTDNPFRIDPSTGIISAVPRTLGQFLLGIKVQEYRNGQLLSTVYRDWEVSVLTCSDFVSENADNYSICIGDTNHLKFLLNESDTEKYNYAWKDNPLIIGGAATAGPKITFNVPGTYTLYATVDSRSGCTKEDSIRVHVMDKEQLDFTYSLTGNQVKFTPKNTANRSFKWDFGIQSAMDDTSTIEKPTFGYSNPGIYYVTLWSDDKCTLPITKQIIANFEITDSIMACVNTAVQINRRINPSYRYIWSPSHLLSDSTSSNPSTMVKDEVVFTATLIDTATGIIVGSQRVSVIPIISDSATTSLQFCQVDSSFQLPFVLDQSTRGKYDFLWDNSALLISGLNTEQPIINIKNIENNNLYLTRKNRITGCETRDTITINIIPKPNLDFMADQIPNTRMIQFQAAGDTAITDFKWDFGVPGVKTDTSTRRNPVYRYPVPGNYLVTLTTAYGCGNDTVKTISIPLPIPFVITDTLIVCKNDLINLNRKTDSSYRYEWSPADKINSATIINPVYKADSSRIFTATLYDSTNIHVGTLMVYVLIKPVPAFDSISLPDSLFVCTGIPTKINPNANPRLNYSWSPTQFFDVPQSSNPNVVVLDTRLITVRISDQNNPVCQIEKQIKVIPTSVKVTTSFRDTITCTDNPLRLSAKADKLRVSFEWFDGNQSISKTDTVRVIPSAQKTYKVIGTDTLGCMNMTTVTVASAKITVDATTTSPQGICPGQTTKLNVQVSGPSNGLTYQWSPAAAIVSGANTSNPEVKPTTTTLFTATVTNSNGCISTDTVTVKVHPVTVVTGTANPPTIKWGQSSQITSTIVPGYTYRWSPVDLLNNPSISNPLAKPTKTTTYTLTATTPEGCIQAVPVTITVLEPECAEPYIFLPNAFTPNGDGKNDVLYLRANNITNMSLVIYNRWGEKVFESRNISNGWDGTFNGKKLYPDAFGYYLTVDCGNGKKFQKKGNVTILK